MIPGRSPVAPIDATPWGYRPQLDGLRAVAVALVVAYHLSDWRFPKAGWVGVDLFFALSGYLITTLLLTERSRTGGISLTQFWYRRAVRLLPTLAVVLLVFLTVNVLGAEHAYVVDTPTGRESLIGVVSAGLYVANWTIATGHSANGLSHLWSLAVEEQFYLLWPPVVMLCLRRDNTRLVGRVAAIATVASFAIMAFLAAGLRSPIPTESWWRLYVGTDTRAGAILVGAVLATLEARGRITAATWRSGPGRVTTAAAAATIAVMALTADDRALWFYPWGFIILGLACAVVVGSVSAADGAVATGLSGPVLVWIGKRSYAIYLWHEVFHGWTHGRWGPFGNLLLALPGSLIAAELTFRLIERPAARWRDRRLAPTAA